MSAADRMRVVAVAPLWAVCTAGWGATATLMLAWTAVRGGSTPAR